MQKSKRVLGKAKSRTLLREPYVAVERSSYFAVERQWRSWIRNRSSHNNLCCPWSDQLTARKQKQSNLKKKGRWKWDVASTRSNHKLGFCTFTSPVLNHTHFSINGIYTHAIISPRQKWLRHYVPMVSVATRRKEWRNQNRKSQLHYTQAQKRYLKSQSAQ